MHDYCKANDEKTKNQEKIDNAKSQGIPFDSNGSTGEEKVEVPNSQAEDGQGEAEGGDIKTEETQETGDTPQEQSEILGTQSSLDGNSSLDVKTDRSFQESIKDLVDTDNYYKETNYIEIPKIDLEKVIVENHLLHSRIETEWAESYQESVFNDVDQDFIKFKRSAQKEVNYLVKEFECKKSADAYARASTARTGILNTGVLHTYKYNEDLFKRVTIVPDGKNHGMIFVLDWSGSMARELVPTVKQLINLTSFCRKVQIPFEVYAFTNEWKAAQNAIDHGTTPENYGYHRSYYDDDNYVKNEFHFDSFFYLMNFISSRSSGKDYERMCLNLFREASYNLNYGCYQRTIGLGLSGTPLNESVVMLNYLIPQFKKNNDLQKVNVCILTDGEACTSSYGFEYEKGDGEITLHPRRIDWGVALRDRTTGRTYEQFSYGNCTNIFLKQLRHRNPDVNVLGFRILSGSSLMNFVSTYGSENADYKEIQKQWKKDKSAVIKNPAGYTELYAINNKAIDLDTEFVVKDNAKKGDITRAFKKMLSNKSVNKKLLTSFVSQVS